MGLNPWLICLVVWPMAPMRKQGIKQESQKRGEGYNPGDRVIVLQGQLVSRVGTLLVIERKEVR